jgi:hypothetical protein
LEREGELRQLFHGVYTTHDHADDLASRAEALQKVCTREAVVARRAAAWLHGLDVLPPGQDVADWVVEVLVPRETTPPRRSGCRAFESELPPEDVVAIGELRATSPLRTALDCARYLPRLEAVAALDQFLRTGQVDVERLTVRALALAGLRNAAILRDHIRLSDPRSESPGESWTRVLLVDAGLPTPDLQLPVWGKDGRLLGILDMGYEKYLVGVEFDGEEFHSRADDLRHDRRRRAGIQAVGWDLVVARKGDVLMKPSPVVVATADALIRAGWLPDDERVLERIAQMSAPR